MMRDPCRQLAGLRTILVGLFTLRLSKAKYRVCPFTLSSSMRLALAACVTCVLLVSASQAEELPEIPGGLVLPETGGECSQLASFDQLMRSFLQDNQIPGGALAVTKDGRLVYARGFGFADVQRRERVQPQSLFRLASISKPITAVAVLQQVDRRRLSLDDRLIDVLPQALCTASGQAIDSRWRQVTLRHLLQHRGGWDHAVSKDPMFQSWEIAESLGLQRPPEPTEVVSYMLGRPLDFEPGERYAYSNFGYCLLGRVLERVTGENYETAVRTELLAPLGIHDMRIGGSLLEQRVAGEVRYYTPDHDTAFAVVGRAAGFEAPSNPPANRTSGREERVEDGETKHAARRDQSPIHAGTRQRVPCQYGSWYLEAMDAHGGWIGSAVDVVRFASQVQRCENAGRLSPDLYREMIACPPGAAGHHESGDAKDSFYSMGWQVRPTRAENATDPAQTCNLWHTGALPGTSTLLVARHDGLCWAVLFNTTYTADGKRPADKIDPLVHAAADAVRHWPTCDLFEQLLP